MASVDGYKLTYIYVLCILLHGRQRKIKSVYILKDNHYLSMDLILTKL